MLNTDNDLSSIQSSWLVTGGAGYIGGHVMRALRENRTPAVLLDFDAKNAQKKLTDLSTYENCNIKDKDSLADVFSRHAIEGVIHLAALKSVEESQRRKDEYFQTNVIGTKNILELMVDFNIKKMIFSSTAAVYDAPAGNVVVSEVSPLKPNSYYGKTKLDAEELISVFSEKYSISSMILRYFNVGGSLNTDLRDTSIDNLIPITISKLKTNQTPEIFGDDYETPDGTAIRDYIDVRDVTEAHMRAIKYLNENTRSCVLNIGTGKGYSVREIIEITQEVMGTNKNALIKGRREGDVSAITADISRAKNVLDFEARFDLNDIIKSSIS